MNETGPPLIPREVLPAPVERVKRPRLPITTSDAGRQLSIFGADTTEPSPADLAGLLAGPGRLGRMGGTARVSVTVDAAWRVHALVTELVSRGLVVNWHEDVREVEPPVVPERPEPPLKGEARVRTPPVAATFDPDADPVPDLPSDVDFLPDDERAPGQARRRDDTRDIDDEHAPGRARDLDDVRAPVRARDREDEHAPGPARGRGDTRGIDDARGHGDARGHDDARGHGDARGHDDEARESGDGPAAAAPGVPEPELAPRQREENSEAAAEEVAEGPESPEPPPKPRFEVVTAYSSRLNPLARAWPGAAAQLFLSGPRLRLWVAAAGEPVPGGYALGLGSADHNPEELRAIDAALVRAGLAGRLSEDGCHYVIAGRRRLKRLAELVGDRPASAPPELWPGGAGA